MNFYLLQFLIQNLDLNFESGIVINKSSSWDIYEIDAFKVIYNLIKLNIELTCPC